MLAVPQPCTCGQEHGVKISTRSSYCICRLFSNPFLEADHLQWRFSWPSAVCPGKCQCNFFQTGHDRFAYILNLHNHCCTHYSTSQIPTN